MDINYVPVELPSRCLTYGVSPDSIKIRTFVGRDEQLLVEMSMGNPKKKLLELFRGIIQGVDPTILTEGDVEFILMWEGINSYSNLYPLKVVCPECLKESKIEVDLTKLEKVMLNPDFKQPYEETLIEGKIWLKLLTLADDIEILNFASNGDSSYLYRYALSIVDDKHDAVTRMQALEMFSPKDLGKIKAFQEKYKHGIKYDYKFNCPKCGEENNIIVPFQLDELIDACSRP